jgi:hypothetical protein
MALKYSSVILILRAGLFVVFLVFPALFLQSVFLGASGSPYLAFAIFFLVVSLVAGFLAVVSLNQVIGYIAFLAVLVTELIANQSVEIFSIHIAVGLIFVEGVSSLKPYQTVARDLKSGGRENVSVQLSACLRRYRRAFLLVSGSLLVVSFGYSVLPQVLPIVSDIAALALYAAIGLVAIGITTLYLGQRAEHMAGKNAH